MRRRPHHINTSAMNDTKKHLLNSKILYLGILWWTAILKYWWKPSKTIGSDGANELRENSQSIYTPQIAPNCTFPLEIYLPIFISRTPCTFRTRKPNRLLKFWLEDGCSLTLSYWPCSCRTNSLQTSRRAQLLSKEVSTPRCLRIQLSGANYLP